MYFGVVGAADRPERAAGRPGLFARWTLSQLNEGGRLLNLTRVILMRKVGSGGAVGGLAGGGEVKVSG